MHTPASGRPAVVLMAAFVACAGPATPQPPAPPSVAGGSGGGAGRGAGGSRGGAAPPAPTTDAGSSGGGGSGGGAGSSGTGGTGTIDASSGVGGPADSAPARPDAALDSASASPGEVGSVAPAPSACPELTGGWMPYTATKTVQFEGGDSFCTYRDEGGIEFFKMMKNPAGVVQRCEARVHNDYRTGSNQFEGDVRVTIGDFTSVHQVFKSFMLDAFPADGGQLRVYTGGAPVITGAFGKWVHVNTIHDTATNNIELYINCARRYASADRDTPGPNGFYNKYGIYGVLGKPPAGAVSQVEWRNVRYYRK